MITHASRIALLMHGHLRSRNGKMGFGLLRYSDATIVCAVGSEEPGADMGELTGIERARGVPVVASVADALHRGADTLVIAVATSGGVLPPGFREEIVTGLRGGMSLVNGLHGTYADDPDFASARQPNAFIWDVRAEPKGLVSGRGRAAALSCRRVLTVGTDMAIGKMTASLELDRAAKARGLRSWFVATGQIGICISGHGVALDAVRVDFASGAIEAQCLEHGPGMDVLWVEGQGSALHPGSTAWVPLLRGSMATDMVLVHRPGQTALDGIEDIVIPPLPDVIALYERAAQPSPSYPAAKVRAIALNCGTLSDAEAAEAVRRAEADTGLPAADVVRHGATKLLDALSLSHVG